MGESEIYKEMRRFLPQFDGVDIFSIFLELVIKRCYTILDNIVEASVVAILEAVQQSSLMSR